MRFTLGETMTSDEEPLDDFLEHFGVKGMKWGVRRSRPSGSSGAKKPATKSPVTKKPEGKAVGKETAPGQVKKRVSDMSTEEIQKEVSRMNLERQYAQLMKEKSTKDETKTRAERVANFTTNLLAEAGQKAIKEVAQEATKKATKKVTKKLLAKTKYPFLAELFD